MIADVMEFASSGNTESYEDFISEKDRFQNFFARCMLMLADRQRVRIVVIQAVDQSTIMNDGILQRRFFRSTPRRLELNLRKALLREPKKYELQ